MLPLPVSRLLKNTRVIGPGIVMAATGIGASDFFSAIWAGSQVGRSLLWAVIFGALLKYYLTEGMARRQILTGRSLVEDWMTRTPSALRYLFGVYFLIWSVCVSSMIMGAASLSLRQLFPAPFASERASAIFFGLVQGGLALGLVSVRGYARFEIVMRVLVGLTLVAICYCLFSVGPDVFPPASPWFRREDSVLILAIVTGVGGTLTLLSYGHWIREKGYNGPESLSLMRLDCGAGYTLSAVVMIVILLLADGVLRARGIVANSEGAARAVFATLAGLLVGWPGGPLVFKFGFWSIVTASMLGVWQSVPHVFAEGAFAATRRPLPADVSASREFRAYRILIFMGGAGLLVFPMQELFLLYALVSALFFPFLAASLLYWNNGRNLPAGPNTRRATAMLALGLLLFLYIGASEILRIVGELLG